MKKRLVIELKDIDQIVLRCTVKDCTGEVSNSLADFEVPDRCPQCKEEWESPKQLNWALIRQIKTMVEGARLPASVRFVIKGQEDKDG